MRKLIVSLSILAIAACTERSSDPAVAVVGTHANIFVAPSSPPPPPLDSGSYSQTEYGSSSRIGTTYFFNKTGNNGWLTFQKAQEPGTFADPNARISYNKGDVSGKGSLTFAVGGGSVTLDLSSVSGTFANSDDGYFNLSFSRGTYTPKTGKTVALSRGSSFSMNPPKEACVGDRICSPGK